MNLEDKISKYFSYREALWLAKWGRAANEADGLNDKVLSNLKLVFAKMDLVREFFNAPVFVTSAYRPQEYNSLIGGAKDSCHMLGMAVDFKIKDLKCDDIRSKILQEGKLETWELRMEDLPGSNWVHLDIRSPVKGRFFKPNG